MDIRATTTPSGATVAVTGRFDAHEAAGFRETVEPLLAAGGVVGLDLSGVVFLDSTALSELVRARKHARTAGGDTVVTDVSDPVRVILELTGLTAALTTPRTDAPARPR